MVLRRSFAAGLVVFVALGGAAARAAAYDWPVQPFDRQHPIRGNFGDPRTRRGSVDATGDNPMSFHSGVDIQARDGTPVYAVEAGVVSLTGRTAVAVATPWASPRAPLVLGYWHIDPVVGDFQFVGRHQLLGYIHPGAGHVHLSERRFGGYVNPLRRGGLTPYTDARPPVIRSVDVYRAGTQDALSPEAVSGRIDLVVDAYDEPPIAPRPPWAEAIVSPARIWWSGVFAGAWLPPSYRPQSVDFDRLPSVPLTDVYAFGTRQNGPKLSGRLSLLADPRPRYQPRG